MGVRSSLLISLYRVSLYFLDFTEFVSYGQVSSVAVNSSLISIATSGLAWCNSVYCCGPVYVTSYWRGLYKVAGLLKPSISAYKRKSCQTFFSTCSKKPKLWSHAAHVYLFNAFEQWLKRCDWVYIFKHNWHSSEFVIFYLLRFEFLARLIIKYLRQK